MVKVDLTVFLSRLAILLLKEWLLIREGILTPSIGFIHLLCLKSLGSIWDTLYRKSLSVASQLTGSEVLDSTLLMGQRVIRFFRLGDSKLPVAASSHLGNPRSTSFIMTASLIAWATQHFTSLNTSPVGRRGYRTILWGSALLTVGLA